MPLPETSETLVCPDCGTSFEGVDSATCTNGHKQIKLDWFPVCKCGHGSHYDMTTFCLTEGCECDAWDPGDSKRQVTRRTI